MIEQHRPARRSGDETGISIKPISDRGHASGSSASRSTTPARTAARRSRRPQGQHHEVHRRPVPARWPARSPRSIPDIEFEDRIVDNMCMQLVQKPELYDVLVLPNLYGDIVSATWRPAWSAAWASRPARTSAPTARVFEATHGSAPKYKGQNKVNPTALILSGMLMLRHLGETRRGRPAGKRRRRRDRRRQARHLRPEADRNDPTAVGTREMADAIVKRLDLTPRTPARPHSMRTEDHRRRRRQRRRDHRAAARRARLRRRRARRHRRGPAAGQGARPEPGRPGRRLRAARRPARTATTRPPASTSASSPRASPASRA